MQIFMGIITLCYLSLAEGEDKSKGLLDKSQGKEIKGRTTIVPNAPNLLIQTPGE